MHEIYVSTGAFKSKNLRDILELAKNAKLHYIELAPGLKHDEDTSYLIKNNADVFSFLVHNYFPAPKEDFTLNLASTNSSVINRSMDMCKGNIKICYSLGIPYYSIHCGFCFDTDGEHLGKSSQVSLECVPVEVAKDVFINNLKELCDYAKQYDIKITIENNVLAGFASDKKNIMLGVTSEDIKEILERCSRSNLQLLLDLGHAKVSSKSLNFNLLQMVDDLKEYIMEVHISDNDGINDLNLPIKQDSYDLLKCLELLKNKVWTIEAYNLEIKEIEEQIALLSKSKESHNE